MALEKELQKLDDFISRGSISNPKVSEKDTFWHIDHAMRVIAGVVNLLNNDDSYQREKKLNWSRLYLFTFRRIPRGSAKAPRSVTSEEKVTLVQLEKRKRNVRFAMRLLEKIPDEASFLHLYVGTLNKKKALTFLKIHTRHHLKIIQDISNK